MKVSTLLQAFAGLVITSTCALAGATYNFVIDSSAPYEVYRYDLPTDTSGISGPYLSPTSTTGGTMTGTATATSSSETATAYVGAALGGPTWAVVECGFQVIGGAVNSDGTCTAPTTSVFKKQGTASAPHCYNVGVSQVSACAYTVRFTYAP